MITPRFSVEQDEARVYVKIHAPHVRAQTVEFDVDEDQFKFYASPYYLRLTFPGKVVEDETSSASFDAASGDISVSLAKQVHGEKFENLDLLTSLLATRREKLAEASQGKERVRRPIIEEIGAAISAEDQMAIMNDEDFDWELPQNVLDSASEPLVISQTKYGFNEQYSGFLTHVHSTANEINEVDDPENASAEERRQGRVAAEDAKFDDGYYMDNYVNDEDIQPLIQYKTEYYLALRKIQKHSKQAGAEDTTIPSAGSDKDAVWGEFTESEQKTMLDLPRKTHMISNRQAVYLGLVDILFAYALDYRINVGEPTVESAWAIGAVSSSLSNLEQFSSLQSVIVACFRRGLSYPLYRNWELCEKALEDVYTILKLGRRAILKCMLQIKDIFDKHDVYYIYSKIFLDDYCVWLQTAASEKAMRSLAHKLRGFEVEKDSTGWKLDHLEDLALESSESEAESEEEADAVASTGDGLESLAEDIVKDSRQMESLSIGEEQHRQIRMPDTVLGGPPKKKLVQIIGEGVDEDEDNGDDSRRDCSTTENKSSNEFYLE
ncbi:hypothetical protein GGI15_001685 [Coemansia interrupta]|uniref:CS domain-containing protein n=1 Tax=Coemansia interrupta TaxID=1126814 RepID=A0A9W8LM88_9FUNG|nr:hypothetical protein GGI15_001685 [Coemansia interrupta]